MVAEPVTSTTVPGSATAPRERDELGPRTRRGPRGAPPLGTDMEDRRDMRRRLGVRHDGGPARRAAPGERRRGEQRQRDPLVQVARHRAGLARDVAARTVRHPPHRVTRRATHARRSALRNAARGPADPPWRWITTSRAPSTSAIAAAPSSTVWGRYEQRVQSLRLAGSLSLQLTTRTGSPGDASAVSNLRHSGKPPPPRPCRPLARSSAKISPPAHRGSRAEPVEVRRERLGPVRGLVARRTGARSGPRSAPGRSRPCGDEPLGREHRRHDRASANAGGRASTRVTCSTADGGAGDGVHPPQHVAVAPGQQAMREAQPEDGRRERVDGQPDPPGDGAGQRGGPGHQHDAVHGDRSRQRRRWAGSASATGRRCRSIRPRHSGRGRRRRCGRRGAPPWRPPGRRGRAAAPPARAPGGPRATDGGTRSPPRPARCSDT